MSSYDGALDIFSATDGVEVLQQTALFAKLGFEETRRLAELSHVERFAQGTVVVEQDSLGQALYIVRSGEVTVLRHDSRGQRDTLQILGPGELFGEMSLVDDLLVSADVEVTSSEVEVVVVPRDAFQQLLESDERLAAKVYKSFCRTLSERLRKLNEKFAELHDEETGGLQRP